MTTEKNKLFSITAFLAVVFFATQDCHADRNDKPGVVKRRYVHACPAGTEQVGDGPPKSSIIFCRQLNGKGYNLEGEYVTFFPNGNKKTEGAYVSGKKTGTWKVYSKSGEILETREFQEGLVKKKELAYAKKYVPHEQRGQEVKNSNRPFSQDREVLNALRVTKTKSKATANYPKLVYGISAK